MYFIYFIFHYFYFNYFHQFGFALKLFSIYTKFKGSISEQIDNGRQFSEIDVLKLFKEILIAYQHLISNQVVHCNISLDSIFTKEKEIKFSDFLVCRDETKSGSSQFNQTVIQSMPSQMQKRLAPEILQGQIATIKSDIYSLGLVLQELLSKVTKSEGKFQEKLAQFNGENIDLKTKKYLKSMLDEQPQKRPNYQDLVNLCSTLILYLENGSESDPPKNEQNHLKNVGIKETYIIIQQLFKERNKIIFLSKLIQDMIKFEINQDKQIIIIHILLMLMRNNIKDLLFILDEMVPIEYQQISIYFHTIFKSDQKLVQVFKVSKEGKILKSVFQKEFDNIDMYYEEFKQNVQQVISDDDALIIDKGLLNKDIISNKIKEYVEQGSQEAYRLKMECANDKLFKKILIHCNQMLDVINLKEFFEQQITVEEPSLFKQKYFSNMELQNGEKLNLILNDKLEQLNKKYDHFQYKDF